MAKVLAETAACTIQEAKVRFEGPSLDEDNDGDTFWCRKMEHVSIVPEHVDLLYTLNWLHIELLENRLQFFVILSPSGLCFSYNFSANSSFST